MALKKIAICFYSNDLDYPEVLVNPSKKSLDSVSKSCDYILLVTADIPEPSKAPCVVLDLTKKGKK